MLDASLHEVCQNAMICLSFIRNRFFCGHSLIWEGLEPNKNHLFRGEQWFQILTETKLHDKHKHFMNLNFSFLFSKLYEKFCNVKNKKVYFSTFWMTVYLWFEDHKLTKTTLS